MRNRVLAGTTGALMVVGLMPGAAQGSAVYAVPGPGVVAFDFNGDGYADLAVGVPGEDVGTRADAGVVHIIPGSHTGPTPVGDQLWHQNRAGIKDSAERGDRFGDALASGDFDADGYADLAIGVPGESLGGRRAGAVQVLYGSARGLTARDQLWHQNRAGVPGGNQSGDRFGQTLAVGDFDGDGFADLAIGVPGEDHSGIRDAGRAVVLRGSATGLTAVGAQRWDESSAGIADDPGDHEYLGSVLAAGDVGGDGRDDLAIATRIRTTTPGLRVGIHVLPGGTAGLTATGSQFLRDAPELTRDCVEADCGVPFGDMVLADFNADGRHDLGHAVIPGRVVVRYARDTGFGSAPAQAVDVTPGADQSWAVSPDDGLMAAGAGPDLVGAALSAGDLTGDGISDLAIGAPGWGDAQADVGTVFVVPGSRTVMAPNVGQHAAGTDPGERFGAALAILPIGGTTSWLAMGAPGDSVAGRPLAGSATLCPGSATPPGGSCSAWHQNTPGIRGTAEKGDGFSTALGQ